MEPTILLAVSASAAAGAALGYFGGRKPAPESDVPPTPSVDPRVDTLGRENDALRRLSGITDFDRVSGDKRFYGAIREELNACLADLMAARQTRAAAFFDEDALLVAGDLAEEETQVLAHFLSQVRPPGAWRTLEWRGPLGDTLFFEKLRLGTRSFVVGVHCKGALPDSALSRTRYAFEGLSVATPNTSDAVISAGDASFESVQRMLDSAEFTGILVLSPSGEASDAAGVRPPRGTDAAWRRLRRFESLHLTEGLETEAVAWTDVRGRRYAMHPFQTDQGRGLLLTVDDAAALHPYERCGRWARQIAVEFSRKSNGGSE